MTIEHNKSGIWDNFQASVDEVHKEAETAARKKQTDKLLEATDWLRRAQELESRHLELLRQVEKLTLEWDSPTDEKLTFEQPANFPSRTNEIVYSDDSGGKPRASECRGAFLDREKKRGNPLRRLRGSYFKNTAGLTIGITWSFESKDKSCPWFFNLLEGQFDEAVLLCEINKEAVQVIHLPKTFLDRYAKQMSRGKNGRIMFNVGKRNGIFFLQLPNPVGWVDVSNYAEKEPLACPHVEFV
jgi:hypothetical protein